jgi:hypothetical protein
MVWIFKIFQNEIFAPNAIRWSLQTLTITSCAVAASLQPKTRQKRRVKFPIMANFLFHQTFTTPQAEGEFLVFAIIYVFLVRFGFSTHLTDARDTEQAAALEFRHFEQN